MAESWVRLWAGTTTDPKWQTIARKSRQPRHLVMALFMHLLMLANDAEDRGDVSAVSIEDAASALDCDEDQIAAILEAMHGRVIEDGRLSGWEKRQPARNDEGDEKTGAMSAAERKRRQRERERQGVDLQTDVTTSHDESRDVTTSHAPEAEAEADIKPSSVVASSGQPPPLPPSPAEQHAPSRPAVVCGLLRKAGMADSAPHYLADETWQAILAKRTDEEIVELARAKMAGRPGQRTGLKYIAPALLDDPEPVVANAQPPPRRRTIHDERADTIAALTRTTRPHERTEPRDITAESFRVA